MIVPNSFRHNFKYIVQTCLPSGEGFGHASGWGAMKEAENFNMTLCSAYFVNDQVLSVN